MDSARIWSSRASPEQLVSLCSDLGPLVERGESLFQRRAAGFSRSGRRILCRRVPNSTWDRSRDYRRVSKASSMKSVCIAGRLIPRRFTTSSLLARRENVRSKATQAPTVDAGPDLFLRGVPATATLNGQVFDDGLPVVLQLRIQWSKLSGPGTVDVWQSEFGGDVGDVQHERRLRPAIGGRRSRIFFRQAWLRCAWRLFARSMIRKGWWRGGPGNNTDLEMLNGYDAVQGSGESYTQMAKWLPHSASTA